MIERILNLLNRFVVGFNPRLPDLGTAFLGIAAILFSKAYPESATLTNVDFWTLASSIAFLTLGLFIRALYEPPT